MRMVRIMIYFSQPDDDDGAIFGSPLHPRRLRKALGLGAVSNCGDHKEQRPFFQYFTLISMEGREISNSMLYTLWQSQNNFSCFVSFLMGDRKNYQSRPILDGGWGCVIRLANKIQVKKKSRLIRKKLIHNCTNSVER